MYILLRPPAQNRRSAVGFRNKGASRFSTAEVQISPPPLNKGNLASENEVRYTFTDFTLLMKSGLTLLYVLVDKTE